MATAMASLAASWAGLIVSLVNTGWNIANQALRKPHQLLSTPFHVGSDEYNRLEDLVEAAKDSASQLREQTQAQNNLVRLLSDHNTTVIEQTQAQKDLVRLLSAHNEAAGDRQVRHVRYKSV
ncbi:hypothetical protein BGZ60DRAFT_413212 [Tricladium varicosporioides]|nr:hypothetical protein BGZ60DRAFT_413212 [Hymenoscyphus varicosporioides]